MYIYNTNYIYYIYYIYSIVINGIILNHNYNHLINIESKHIPGFNYLTIFVSFESFE